MDFDPKILAKRIASERNHREWSQAFLAEKAETSVRNVQDLEYAKIKNPGLLVVLQIAQAMGLTLDELIGSPAKPKRDASALSFLSKLGTLSPLHQSMVLALVFDDSSYMRGASKKLFLAVEALLESQT